MEQNMTPNSEAFNRGSTWTGLNKTVTVNFLCKRGNSFDVYYSDEYGCNFRKSIDDFKKIYRKL